MELDRPRQHRILDVAADRDHLLGGHGVIDAPDAAPNRRAFEAALDAFGGQRQRTDRVFWLQMIARRQSAVSHGALRAAAAGDAPASRAWGTYPRHRGSHMQAAVDSRHDWTQQEIEALFVALGAEVSEREGSRIGVYLFDQVRVFHRPHPAPDTDKGAVASIRKWLEENGVTP